MNQRERITKAVYELVYAICPEVEPERPEHGSDRCGCAMFGYIHARKECDAYRDKPAEPVIDEAFVYAVETEAGISGFLTIKQAEEVIEKQTRIIRELRSNACGGSSERSSPVSSSEQSEPSGSSRGASGTASATEPAHAADPYRSRNRATIAVCRYSPAKPRRTSRS